MDKVRELVKKYHEGQMYGNKPYTYHLNQVVSVWTEFFCNNTSYLTDEDKLSIGVCCLHDILEDCPEVTVDLLLQEGISQEIVNAVVLVTKEEGYNYKEYLRRICTNRVTWEVKVSDTYSNLTESIKEGNVKRVKKYSKQLELLYKFKE